MASRDLLVSALAAPGGKGRHKYNPQQAGATKSDVNRKRKWLSPLLIYGGESQISIDLRGFHTTIGGTSIVDSEKKKTKKKNQDIFRFRLFFGNRVTDPKMSGSVGKNRLNADQKIIVGSTGSRDLRPPAYGRLLYHYSIISWKGSLLCCGSTVPINPESREQLFVTRG